MSYAYALWSGLLLGIWLLVFAGLRVRESRRQMLITSGLTALLGLTEPLFVPDYWDPRLDDICEGFTESAIEMSKF